MNLFLRVTRTVSYKFLTKIHILFMIFFECDQIPPAYPCEGEKVVFIGVEMNGKLPGAVDHFCKDLNPTRAKGVAFYVLNSNGNTDGLSSIIDTMKKNGVETYGEPLGIAVKGGLFKKGMPTDADTKKVLEWADKIAKM